MKFLKAVKFTILALLLLLLFSNNNCERDFKEWKWREWFRIPTPVCPVWDELSYNLYFVSGGRIARFDANTDGRFRAVIGDGTINATCVVPIESQPKLFAVSMQRRVEIIEWDGVSKAAKKVNTLFELEETEEDKDIIIKFAADVQGRFYGVTNGENGGGTLYKWEKDDSPTKLVTQIKHGVGIAWNFNNTRFYLVDGFEEYINEYHYDATTGDISNIHKIKIETTSHKIVSFTIDERGDFWLGETYFKSGETYPGLYKLKGNGKRIIGAYFQHCPKQEMTGLGFGFIDTEMLFVFLSSSGGCYEVDEFFCLGSRGVEAFKLKI